jgi:hypothetical protein
VADEALFVADAAETYAGDRGTGVAHGLLSDVEGPFGRCEQTLMFERRR